MSDNISIHSTAIVDEGAIIERITHMALGSYLFRSRSAKPVLGQNVFVGNDVIIGNNCKVQNNVSVYMQLPWRMMYSVAKHGLH